MSTELAKNSVIKAMLTKREKSIKALLPNHVNKDRFITSAILAVSNNNDLQRCTAESVLKAIINAAELGLDFTPSKRLAYLVPFGNQATFMIGYAGFIQLAVNAKAAKRFAVQIVHEKDTFKYTLTAEPYIVHDPYIMGDPGRVIGAYCRSWDFDGTEQTPTFMRLDELEKVRGMSKMKSGAIWTNHTEEMYKKTTIRRHSKMLPLSPDRDGERFAKALELDNSTFEDGKVQGEPDGRTRTEQLADIISDAEYTDMPSETEEADKPKRGRKPKDQEPETPPEPDPTQQQEPKPVRSDGKVDLDDPKLPF